jgi:hypothetical protein
MQEDPERIIQRFNKRDKLPIGCSRFYKRNSTSQSL